MNRGLLFWIIMLVLLVFGFFGVREAGFRWHTTGMSIVEFVLLALLGWQVYGPAVKQ